MVRSFKEIHATIQILTRFTGRRALPKSSTSHGHPRRRNLTTSLSRLQLEQKQEQQEPHFQPTVKLPTQIRDPNHPVAQDFAFYHHQKAHTKDLGSSIAPHYRPHQLVSNPPGPEDVTLELLMASQAHIGHATSLWHPSNAKYIFGVRGREDPIHIISLDITAAYLRRACKIVRGVTSRGGIVLFVGTRNGQVQTVVNAAARSKGCHLFTKWVPGSITNGQQILGQCAKKVVDEHDRTIPGFGDQLPQTSALKPDLVVCLNPLENSVLLHECGLHNIPTIGIVDTDVNPSWVTYPIPANDDSLRSVQVICGVLGRAGEEGQKIRRAKARQGVVVSMPSHGLLPPTEGQAERDLEADERARLVDEALQKELMIESEAAAAEHARQRALQEPETRDEELAELSSLEDGATGNAAFLDRASGGEAIGGEEWQYEDEAFDQPYERDRPLTEEELLQALVSANQVGADRDAVEHLAEDTKKDS